MTKRIKRPVGRGLAVAKAGRSRTIRVSVCGGPDLLIKAATAKPLKLRPIPGTAQLPPASNTLKVGPAIGKSRIENPKSKIR